MKSTMVFRSDNKNHYLYDARLKNILFVHPELAAIAENNNKGKTINEAGSDNSAKYTEQELYYRKQYDFLKSHGWFGTIDNQEKLSPVLTPFKIENTLANLMQLTFEVTEDCNLNCSYCAYNDLYGNHDKRKGNYMDFNMAKSVIDYLVPLWKSPLNTYYKRTIFISFYGGEPLMNMDLIKKIVAYVSGIDIECRFLFSMTTNGILIKKEIEYIVEHNFRVMISLDGDKDNNSYRVNHAGKPMFDTIIENIRYIRDKYPDYFRDNITFNSVLHNKNSIKSVLDFFKKEFDIIPRIGEINNVGINPEQVDRFKEMYRNRTENLLQTENYEKIEKDLFVESGKYRSLLLFIKRYVGNTYSYNSLFLNNHRTKRYPTGTCLPFSRKMFVTVNGKILPCERIGHQHVLGAIENGKVKLDFPKIAAIYNAHFDKLRKQCHSCHNIDSCGQCVFNLSDLENNPKCYGHRNKKDFGNYLCKNISCLEKEPDVFTKLLDTIII